VANQGAEGQPDVGFFPFMPGCNFSQEYTGESGENDGGGEQDDCIEKTVPNNRGHGLTVMKGNAQIPGHEVFKIIDILGPYGPVQSQLGNEMFRVFRGHVWVHDPGNRVAGAQAEQHKEQRQNDKEDNEYLDEPFKDEFSGFHNRNIVLH